MSQDTALEAALALAKAGWFVIPVWWPSFAEADVTQCGCGDPDCGAIAKHPCSDLAPNGQNDSTTNEAIIRGWFEQYPHLNIAVDLLRSGLMALDVDHPDGRDSAIAKLSAAMDKLGALPATVEQISGSGNGHLFYKAPDFPIRGQLESLTVRGRNYCIVAPSLHKSGQRYAWEEGAGPGEIPVSDLPSNWLAALRKPDPVSDAGMPDAETEPDWLRAVPLAKRVVDMRAHLVKEQGEQMGIDPAGTCFNVCRTSARGYAVRDPNAVFLALKEIYNPKCDPPYSEADLADRLQKAYDNAYNPSWGSCYEPASTKVSAFFESIGVAWTQHDQGPAHEAPAAEPGAAPSIAELEAELDGRAAALGRRTSGRARICGALIKRVRKHEMFLDDAELADAIDQVHKNALPGTTKAQLYQVLAQCGNPDLVREIIDVVIAKAEAAEAARAKPPEDDEELRSRLMMTEDAPEATLPNVEDVLRWAELLTDAERKPRLRYDVITKEVTCDVPRFIRRPELLATRLRSWLVREWQIRANERDVGQVIEMIAKDHGEWNSVAEYLNSVEWDGVHRLDTWLVDYCQAQTQDLDGNDVSGYVRSVGAMWMIGAVARAVAPEDNPAKMDTVLVLEGTQGLKKSTAFDVLGGAWFSDTPLVLGDKDSRQTAGMVWICELAELASLARSATEAQKAFLSQRRDFYRPPYGHKPYWVTRRAVFAGTVNPEVDGTVEYLQDTTGNRRWWPVRVGGRCDVARLRADRDQLWAEALHRYRSAEMHPERAHEDCPGERWWLEPEEQLTADAVTEQRQTEVPWQDKVLEWAKRQLLGMNGPRRDRWTLEEIAEGAIGIEPKEFNRHKKMLSAACHAAGFRKRKGLRGDDPIRRTYWGHPELTVPGAPDQAIPPGPGWPVAN